MSFYRALFIVCYFWVCNRSCIPSNYWNSRHQATIKGNSGHYGTWGQNGTLGVFLKHVRCGSVFASAWFPSLASVVWDMKIELVNNHIMNTTQKTQFPHSHEFWYINSITFRCRLRWQNKSRNGWFFNGIYYFFTYFHAILTAQLVTL